MDVKTFLALAGESVQIGLLLNGGGSLDDQREALRSYVALLARMDAAGVKGAADLADEIKAALDKNASE